MSIEREDNQEAQQVVLAAKKICLSLQNEDKRTRKQVLIDLQTSLSHPNHSFTCEDLRLFFNETHMYTLNAFRDKSEAVRSQAIKFMSFFMLEKLGLNDYYLTYVFPILVERIGTVELIEESEEIRLELLQFLHAIVLKYTCSVQLKPFVGNIVQILCETVKDKHPEIKETSCKCITDVAHALPNDFHLQAESLVKQVVAIFGYQRYKIRIEAIKCMGEIVMHSSCKGLEEAVGPMAERLFDQIAAVRRTVAQVAARWLLEYQDRYSFFYKLLPLILTGLNDEVPETRAESYQLWQTIGAQYERENEKDLKDQLDFLYQPPKYYPENLTRPNLGCRVLVQRNVGKLAHALANELTSWQTDVKVRCSQLLCAVALHAESGLTQHLQDLLPAMYLAAREEESAVVANVIQASKLMGCFVPPETWTKLILPAIEDGAHYGNLAVLAGLISGAPQEYISPFLPEILKLLADDNICQSRKAKYQYELLACVKAILQKHVSNNNEIGESIFKIAVTVISLKDAQNADISVALLDGISTTLGFNSRKNLWREYTESLLSSIDHEPKAWCVVTPERCIFETLLLESGQAFGENLPKIGNILVETLHIDADAESRLSTFIALSAALHNKDEIFKDSFDTQQFLETLVTDVLVPSLVWHAGRTAEAMRTMAASCLCNALTPGEHVDLFATKDILRPLFDQLLPLLLSLLEDTSSRSRQLALEALTYLKETAMKRDCWMLDDLQKIYPEILKRLDDPTDQVRLTATRVLPIILENPPNQFKNDSFKSHHELLIDTLLTHFDDDDEDFQELIFAVLKVLANVCGKQLEDKINKHKPLLRNQKGCDRIIRCLRELNVSDVM